MAVNVASYEIGRWVICCVTWTTAEHEPNYPMHHVTVTGLVAIDGKMDLRKRAWSPWWPF